MNVSFNVLEQAWIPTVSLDGEVKQLGIRQVLSQAHELKEISNPSPLEEYSIYRFLGLFLMDALRPNKRSDIRETFRTGHFEMDRIEQYIKQCESEGVSFDLFDIERPFLQCKRDNALDGQVKPISTIDCTLPSGNNHTHFIHQPPETISPARAVTLLLTTYWFCTAAAQGYPSGVYGAPPYFGVIKGKNLFETLSNQLYPTDLIGIALDDPPVLWRRMAPVYPKTEIAQTSWMQGMLFPTRRICLRVAENGLVDGVYLSQGENYVNKETWRDPYVTYRSNETTVFPLRPHADSPIWRNYCDILDIPGNHASLLLNLYRTLHGDEDIHITLYGVETSNASYLSVNRHDLVLPLKLAEPDDIELLTVGVSIAQQLASKLRNCLKDIQAIPRISVSMAGQSFERICGDRFWTLCQSLCDDKTDMSGLLAEYCENLSKDALTTYDSAVSSLQLRAHSLADAELNRDQLFSVIIKLRKGLVADERGAE